jgi:kumamolisin
MELKGSERAALPGGQDVGQADPNQQIEVTIFLRRGSQAAEFTSAAEMGARLPRERKYLTREEIARLDGASVADLKKIQAFAKQYGLKVVSEDRARRIVKLSGAVHAFNGAFGANLRRYEHTSGTYRCRTGAHTIPANLESIVEGVFGLEQSSAGQNAFSAAQETVGSSRSSRGRFLLPCPSRQNMRLPCGRHRRQASAVPMAQTL